MIWVFRYFYIFYVVEDLQITLIFFSNTLGIILTGNFFSNFWKFFKANSVKRRDESFILIFNVWPLNF
jgi:hypothetical protein